MKQMVKMKARVGISPILATVIIIAVTLVIAIGVIGWIMGIWGGFGSTESLQIYPDSYIAEKNGKTVLYLHVKNTGTATASIYKVEVMGVATNSTSPEITSVTPGEEKTLTIVVTTATGQITSGATYQVKIYTNAGNVFSAVVRAE